MRTASTLAACIVVSIITTPLFAQAPDSVSFQGYVTDSGDNPINSAGLSMTFKLYANGTDIWSETQPSVPVANGLFNVLLGSVTPLDTVRFNRPLELGITVGGDPEIVPRTPLAAAAYAKAMPGLYTFYREDATFQSYNVVAGASNNIVGETAVGATIGGGGGVQVATSFPNSVLASHTVVAGGYGNTASEHHATVSGGAHNTSSGSGAVVSGGSLNSVSGASSVVPGGYLNSAEGSYSFAAGQRATAAHSRTFVWNSDALDSFESTASEQFLVNADVGIRTASLAAGTDLHVAGPIYGGGSTILLSRTNVSGTPSDDGFRLRFDGNFQSSGDDYFIFEKTDVNQNAPDGGIVFVNTGADGVVETALRIYGSGSVEIPGNLTKGSGSFKIDHPLDPTNRYLYHSFVESPDMKNVYDGVVALDTEGAAVVEMPAYFEALNRDFRYQLTAIGAPGPNLYVSKEIDGNTFGIAGGDPGMRVSWMVTGIRKDPFAAQNPIEVEVEKSPTERGTYLHPQAYGITR